ncbi:type VI secretion system baseplate subunit TssE [Yersinia similis]|uniref:Lysozyme n=1 Tax=Yersinia similis TaxID=367190 RepID=A0A0T9NPV7_9GAMM|nr:type VI secretion system baseplate subunit TssE [Yersinia similis]AHK19857.1 lysozyme [Yersinia similis]CFQ52318.1 type VI secretion system lysozyme-like protein [Yersinia similis]CNB88986.1 type VI secretion system lysozyme-like protein [Yersinia similis]CNE54862.1 type VI secretion system lysozyme-like protein [Yersinia similis]CNF45642.1 type VI secretion system lysozyme-like protein [Yersinia similis]
MDISAPILFDKLSLRHEHVRLPHWREVIVRDIESLLNDSAHSARLKLKKYPHCESSVLNYGLPSLSQQVPVITDLLELARHIQRIIATFESRLDPRSIKVVPLINKGETWVLAILFDIHARCNLPGEEHLVNLRIALDYSYGMVRVL